MVQTLLKENHYTAAELAMVTGEEKFRMLDMLKKLKKQGVCQSVARTPPAGKIFEPVYDEEFSLSYAKTS
jgi:hypothetical protein